MVEKTQEVPAANTTGSAPPRKSKPGKRSKPKSKEKALRKAISDPGAKGTPWTFPKNTLEDSIVLAKALEEKFAGNPTPAREVAVAVGFNKAEDWRFGDLVRSASLYGLVEGTRSTKISLTDLGRDIVAPSSPGQRIKALREAFLKVQNFSDVENYYKGKRIPEDEFFFNTLTREYNIPKERVRPLRRFLRRTNNF